MRSIYRVRFKLDMAWHFTGTLVLFQLLIAAEGSPLEYDVTIYHKVTSTADHWWNFDEATSLYSIVDKVSETRANIREGGAKLTRHDVSTNNYLTLEGRSSSIELGRFENCVGDISTCSNGFTFSSWIRVRDVVGEDQYILGNRRPLTRNLGFSLLRTKQNQMNVVLSDTHGETYVTYGSSSGKWHHHVVSWDGKDISVYRDGKKLVMGRRKRRNSSVLDKMGNREKRSVASALLTLGRHGFKIDADYDDVMFWNRSLNETEAMVLFYRDLDDPVLTGCTAFASSLCLKWTLPNDAFARIRELQLVYYYLYQTEQPFQFRLNSTSRQACVGFLGSLTTYVFKLEAFVGSKITALKSKEISCKTTDGVPNSPNLRIGDKRQTSIEVIWLTPSPANGVIIAYWITVKQMRTRSVKVNFKMNAHESLPGKIGTYKLNITSLSAGTLYEINLRAVSEIGSSNISTVKVTTEGLPSLPSEDLTTVTVIGEKIRISWKSVENALSYRIYVTPQNGNETHFDVKGTTVELASLKPSTEHVIDVQPIFTWGMGPRMTEKLKVKTPSQQIIPSGVTAVAIGWDKVLVRWNPLPNKEAAYIVFLQTADGKELTRETRQHQIEFDDVKPLTTYTVYIQARFNWGMGPKTFANTVAKTKDVDECKQTHGNKCHPNADCFNVEGSYLCQCRKDFVGDGFNCRPMPENPKSADFCKENTFRDVKWPKILHGGTVVRKCPNGTTGFASRKCFFDTNSQTSIYALPNLSDCVSDAVITFGNSVENPQVSGMVVAEQLTKVTSSEKLYGGDVKKTVTYYDKLIDHKLKDSKLVYNLSQSLLSAAGNLLNNSVLAAWKDLPKRDRSGGATRLFRGLETLAQKLFLNFNNSSFKKIFSTPNIGMELQRVDNPNQSLDYVNSAVESTRQSRISLPTNEIMSIKGKKSADVVYFSYSNVNEILGIEKSANANRRATSKEILNSKVVSAVIVGTEKMVFNSQPVVLVLPHLKDERVLNTSCVFWNISTSTQSKWLDTGCYVNRTDVNETVCHCYHLTNFAVLMTVSTMPELSQVRGHQFVLRVITIIGLTISIIAMAVAFTTFCCFRFLRSARTTYHAHLVASLILADCLFLLGIDRTSNQIACSVIAVLLHYFFTVAFVWMAMEGILLYFMLKKIFSSRNFLKRKRCYVLCWVFPALYVALLGILKIEHYGNESFCWLSRKEGFIWSFVAPVSLALIINFTVMGFAFQVMSKKRNKGPDDGTASDVWYWLKGLLVLSCLLGVTWLLGVFYVDSDTVGFAYIFTLLNALQGLFIFIFHCLIDSRVRSEYMRLIKCQKRSDYNEKAGYSSSMKFRKLSGSIKSLGSLDRSLSHSSTKRTLSNSLDRSLLRQNNGSVSEYGRFTLLRSTSSNKSERNEAAHEELPEMQPLVQRSFQNENEEQSDQLKDSPSSGLHLHDEKTGSSYSSVFEPEPEQRQCGALEVRHSLCIIDPAVDSVKRRWNNQTHGSDSGVSVHSDALQGDSFESNPTESSKASFEEAKVEDSRVDDAPLELQEEAKLSTVSSSNGNDQHPVNVEIIEINQSYESVEKDSEKTACEERIEVPLEEDNLNAEDAPLHILEANEQPLKFQPSVEAEEPVFTVEVIEERFEMPLDVLSEESQTFSIVEDKNCGLNFDKLQDASSVEVCDSVSPVRMNRMIQFEVEELPQIRSCEPSGRCGSPDKRERVETSLRIGVPRLISVSSIESEPISPIIISINPEDKEFSMLEAEIEFSEDDAISMHSQT